MWYQECRSTGRVGMDQTIANIQKGKIVPAEDWNCMLCLYQLELSLESIVGLLASHRLTTNRLGVVHVQGVGILASI